MTENNVSKNMPNNMDVVVVIDKEKLPEDVRKLLEENLPKDILEKLLQDKVFDMLQKGNMGNISLLQRDKGDKADKNISEDNDIPKDNRLFAIQTGTVVGNIYTDDTYKKEEDSYIKKKDIPEQLRPTESDKLSPEQLRPTESDKLSPEQLRPTESDKLSKDLGGCC